MRRGTRLKCDSHDLNRHAIVQGQMQRRAMFFGLAGAAAAVATPTTRWNNRFAEQLRDDLLARWKVEKQYSLDVLDAMRSEHLDLKPTQNSEALSIRSDTMFTRT